MNFVNEEHIAAAQVGQDGRQIASALDDGAGGDLEVSAHFVGDDRGQGRFAQARRAIEQNMIQGFFAPLCRFDQNMEIVAQLVLADHFGQGARAQRGIEGNFFRALRG